MSFFLLHQTWKHYFSNYPTSIQKKNDKIMSDKAEFKVERENLVLNFFPSIC